MDRKRLTIIIAGIALGLSPFTAVAFQADAPGIADAPPGGASPAHYVASPPAKTSIKFDAGKVTIAYSAPSMRKRKIFGELVPYNEVWRAGANAATALHTDVDLKFNGLDVPKGDYTLFVWPMPQQWMLIVSKQTGETGLEYDVKQDLGRVPMELSKAPKPIERFRITLTRPDKTERGHLEMAWENTIGGLDFSVQPK